MSLATSNRDGGRTNEAGHLRGVTKGFIGQVLSGLNVSQRGAGANMSVDVAIGDALINRSDATYGHPAWNDAVYNQVIAAADGSNPRRDIVVMYIDYGQTPSTGVANNTNGVVKIKSVAGTAAGSPVDPSSATIQSSVGSGNPWIKLARVRVAAGATSISNSVIDDLRLLAVGLNQGGWVYDAVYSWVYASASTFTIAGVDATAQFPVGTKIALYQGGSLKYFYVMSSVFATNTTVTVNGGGTYTLTNVPLDRPAYSYDQTPSGYPVALLNIPNNYSTTEVDTGTRFVDGKIIYKRTFTGTITQAAGGRNVVSLMTVDKVLRYEGYYYEDASVVVSLGAQRMGGSGVIDGSDALLVVSGVANLYTKSAVARTNQPYVITLYYTK